MKTTIRLILALMFVIVITITSALLVRKSVSGVQVDLTSENIYTLSDGTRNILTNLSEPITFKLYYSRAAAMKAPDQIRYWNNYYLYVRELLEEYARISDGKIKLKLIDPRAYSIEEEDAIRSGIRRFPMSDDENFYFGLLATTELGKDESIAFFEPNRQELVEYDISKIIVSLGQRKKSKVGVLSSLPVMGPANMSPYMMQMMRMQGKKIDPPWMIARQLQMSYDVQNLQLGVPEIPADIDFLMVIHPKNFDQKTIFSIDQFVMRGGKLLVFVDPHCLADPPPPNPRNPRMPDMNHKAGSALNNLLVNWGAVVYSKKLTVDRAIATKVGSPPKAFPLYLNLDDKCVNKSHPMVAGLNGVRMLFAGSIGRHGGTATFTPLISTTNTGATWEPANPMVLQSRDLLETLQKEAKDGSEAVTLAGILEGPMRSIYPNGIDILDESPPPTATTQPATQPRTKHLDAIKTVEKGTVLVVADVDILSDQLSYQSYGFGMAQSGANVPFVLNALEFLSGSNDLISIRSRGRFLRPFKVVDEIERETDRQTQTQIDEANAELKGYQQELEALSRKGDDVTFLEKKRELEASVTAVQRKIRNIRAVRRKKVEALEFELKAYNTAVAPAILLLIAILLALFRYFRAKHYAAQRA
ncbi:MAG: hypothetical protein HN350_12125 [Phycisphaerales bacterium]|jgi:ABC-2 type transport system permease protein|nr:hypothetical protein [Phycisphaerales bacterium]